MQKELRIFVASHDLCSIFAGAANPLSPPLPAAFPADQASMEPVIHDAEDLEDPMELVEPSMPASARPSLAPAPLQGISFRFQRLSGLAISRTACQNFFKNTSIEAEFYADYDSGVKSMMFQSRF